MNDTTLGNTTMPMMVNTASMSPDLPDTDNSFIFTWSSTTYSKLILAVLGVIGNGLVIAVYTRRLSSSATNEFLVALADAVFDFYSAYSPANFEVCTVRLAWTTIL